MLLGSRQFLDAFGITFFYVRCWGEICAVVLDSGTKGRGGTKASLKCFMPAETFAVILNCRAKAATKSQAKQSFLLL